MKRLQGAILLALLAALSVAKARSGVLPEMLWICHVSAAILAIGLLLDLPALSAVGFLYHIAVAIPTYSLHLLNGGDTTWASFLLHLLAPTFGWLAWRHAQLPRATPWLAQLAFIAAVVVAHYATPPAMNVNLAFHPWEPLAFLGIWLGFAFNVLVMQAQLLTAWWLLNRRRGLHPI
ncbi:MAG: hypothetical protein V4582_21280 [Pseudomonadota bacterium]